MVFCGPVGPKPPKGVSIYKALYHKCGAAALVRASEMV